ncbi:MAG TPA: hypothetical protein VLC10_05215, partial [Patescibacteria group bacterium]|nr:hypothetical protein [Patescibacteria group bacterium]
MFALSGVAALLISVIYVARPTFASGPSSNRVLNYQIRLTDATGIPVADGTKDIKLSFYDAASGGTRLATDCGTTVTPVARKVVFTNGTGSVLLGDTGADGTHNCADASAPNALASSLFSNPVLYLGITVGTDAEMTPRKRIVAQGYALNADLLDDLDTSSIGGSVAFIPATDGSGNLTLTKDLNVDSATLFVDSANGRVGVGTAAPATRLQVTGDTAVTGDYFVDSDGSSLNDHGYFITPIAEGAPLVSAAGQGLCTDSLTTPTKVYMDGNGDCTPGNGGADAVLVFDSAGATVAVTSAWAFNDADTDCDGDGTGGDGGCTASDGIYQDGQDLYVDHTPSATFNSADVGIGTDTPLANLHIIGTGLGNDFADYPAVVAIETQSSTQWSLVFQTRDAGLGKLMGFYQQSFAPFSPFFDSNGGSLLLASDNVIDSIQAWSETDRRTAIGLFDTWSTLAVRSDADKTGLVGTTTANASTTITGVGTMFLRDLGVGDRISLSSAPTVYATVTSITDDLTLAIDAPLGDGTSQTINRKSGILRLEDGNGAVVAAVNDQGRMGVGVINPESQLTVGQNALPIGSIFGGSDGISVSKTLTAYGTAGQFQAVWDFPSAGFGITGTVSVAQTRDTNANNMTGVMTGSQGIAEHLGPGSATEIVGVQGGAYDRVGGTTADAIGVWGTTTAQTSTITNAVGVRGENNIFSSGNITNAFAVAARQGSLTSGTIAGNVGLQVDDFTVGTNKTDVLVGTQTIPAGNFSLYNASSYDSYFAGKLGVGTAAPGQLLDVRGRAAVGAQTASNFWPSDLNTLLVNEQSADTGTAHTGVQSDIEWNPAASSAAFTTYASGKYSAATTASNAFNLTNGFVEGVIASAHHEGTGTVGNLIGAEGLATNTTTGTVTTATGLTATAQTVAAGGTITTAYGGRFRVSTFGGAITNGYAVQARDGSVSGGGSIASKAGVDIEEITNATNNTDLLIGTATIPGGNYALYNASTRDTYFAGNVGIG